MTKDNLVTAPEGTTLEKAKGILQKHKVEKLPIVDKDGNLKGLITVKDIFKAINYPLAAGTGRTAYCRCRSRAEAAMTG